MNQGMAVGAPEHAGRRRLRRVLTAVATVVALVQVVVAVAVWLQVPAGRERGIDISTSYVAAGVWREGKGDRLYDQQLEARRHAALNVPGFRTDLPFITPPLTAVVAAPATLLGPDRGLRVLSVLAVLALAVSLLIAAGAAPHPRGGATRLALLLGIAAVPTIPLFLMGQWDGTCALGLACAYAAWRRERALLAGLALAMGIGLAKPHLGLGLAAYVIGRRDGRAALGAAAGLVALGVASLLLVGLRASVGFIGALQLSLAHSAPASTLGMSGLSASWLGRSDLATAVTVVGSLTALAGAGWLGRRSRTAGLLEPTLAGATALSLLATPHLLSHDLVLLAPAMVWVGLWASQPRGLGSALPAWATASWLLFDAAALADLGNAAPAPPGRVIPLLLAAGGVAALRSGPRRRAPQSGSGRGRGGVLS